MNHKGGKKKKGKCSKSRSQSVVSDKFLNDYKEEDSSLRNIHIKKGMNFSVRTSKIMGRYMVADRELKPGDVILNEYPLVVGPCTACRVQCISCYHPLESSGVYAKCRGCGWPLCSQKCPTLGKKYAHTEYECNLLRDCKSSRFLNYDDFETMRENFYSIVPLRCLMLKTTNRQAYEVITSMEHHDDLRRNIKEVWETNQRLIVDKIVKDWQLVEFSEQEVHSICGILEVNAFEIGQQGVNIRGLYPSAFLMSHNCIPNTSHSDDENDFKLTVRASTQIQQNHPITLSYAYTLQSTLKRREHLLDNKFFRCMCERCKDPTECGTNTGALLCPKCKSGLVLSTDPLDPNAAWTCDNSTQLPAGKCPGYTITSNSMELLIQRITDEIDKVDSNDIKGMEFLLQKYRNVLHPTHYLCLELKLNLSQLYGKIGGYLIHELDDDLLRRKMEICKDIIKVFDVIEPGFTRLRGVTLYELHAPVLILTTRQFERHQLDKTQLRHRIKEVVRYLEEASIILAFEPECSSEGMMGIAAKDALQRMKEWGKVVGRI